MIGWQAGTGGAAETFLLPLATAERQRPSSSTFPGSYARISPDGHFLAYQSNESGRFEVYVRPFPNIESGRAQVSSGGGTSPVWARSGLELFYLDNSGGLMAAPVESTTPTFSTGSPVRVLKTAYVSTSSPSFDVSPDGRRFLMIKPTTPGNQGQTGMVLVLNWTEELKARVPAAK